MIILPAEVSIQKGIKLKTFRRGYVISLCGDSSGKVWSRWAEGAGFDSFTTLFFHFPFFSRCFVLLFSIHIYLNNCYSIKCNKRQEEYRVSREEIAHRILNIWVNNLNFYHFLQFTVGKPELITTCRNDHFLNNVPTSSFYRLMVIITFQHVNRTFDVIFIFPPV